MFLFFGFALPKPYRNDYPSISANQFSHTLDPDPSVHSLGPKIMLSTNRIAQFKSSLLVLGPGLNSP
jgi:hypothetical protein